MNVSPKVKIDTTQLSEAIRISSQYTKRTLPQVINTAAYWVAFNTKEAMPYVKVERIDADFGVIYSPGLTPKGKISKNKKNKVINFTEQPDRRATRAELIIFASMHPGSRYNQRTNSRWYRPIDTLKGKTKSERQTIVLAMARRMTKRRHSSIKFLRAGFIPAVRKLFPHAQHKFSKITASPISESENGSLGGATVAIEGLTVEASIFNSIGMEGPNAKNYNNALHLYGAPALQTAIDNEGQSQMNYALSKMGQGVKEAYESK